MFSDKLGNNRIDIRSVPPKEKGSECDEPKILVEYLENTVWAIPVRECLTWFVSFPASWFSLHQTTFR